MFRKISSLLLAFLVLLVCFSEIGFYSSCSYALGTVKDGWVLANSESVGNDLKRDTWVSITSNKTLRFDNFFWLYCSSEQVSSGVCLLKNKTSGTSVSETKITTSSTGIYLFNPLQTSVLSGLPSSFVSGWVSDKNLIVAPMNQTQIKADIQTDKQFNGVMMFRLSVGDFGLIKFKTSWLNLSSQTFLSAKNQLKQDFSFASPIKISKNDRIFLEFGVRITSVSPSTTIVLNVNTMETTAILLPTFAMNKCFYIGASNQVNPITSPNAATTPLPSTSTYLINASDNVYLTTGASATTLHRYGNVAHRFTFNCSGYTSITDISITWEGYDYGTVADLKKVQIYNSSALWENWQNSIPTTDTSYSKSLGTGTNYFYNSTWIMFGDYAYHIPISSTKSMVGHLLGASGAVEAVACIKTIVEGIIHPTVNYEYPDPDCDLDYVPNVARKKDVRVALSNSFGFGGQNACLVLRRFEE